MRQVRTFGILAALSLLPTFLFSSAVEVRIKSTPEIPLAITSVHVSARKGGLEHGEYMLVNKGTQRLLAVEVTWHVKTQGGES